MSERKTCGTCCHWDAIGAADGTRFGECRRFPPCFIGELPTTTAGWCYPTVYETRTACGEYKPAVATVLVSSLRLSVRARACVERLGVQTVGELAAKTEAEIMACRNTGETTLAEIRDRLAERGLTLGEKP